jgi:hypothetical protein
MKTKTTVEESAKEIESETDSLDTKEIERKKTLMNLNQEVQESSENSESSEILNVISEPSEKPIRK